MLGAAVALAGAGLAACANGVDADLDPPANDTADRTDRSGNAGNVGNAGNAGNAGDGAGRASPSSDGGIDGAGRRQEPRTDATDATSNPPAPPAPVADAGRDALADARAETGAPVIDAAPPPVPTGACLRISEYIEMGATKAVELWNCGAASLALGRYVLCLESNASTTCTTNFALTGSLAAGATHVVCGPGFTSAACTSTSGVANFNGNDRIGLFFDTNSNGTVDRATDPVVDSFGRLGALPPAGVAPPSTLEFPWEDTDLRRSTCTPFLGGADFNAGGYYAASAGTDETNLGVAPAITCP